MNRVEVTLPLAKKLNDQDLEAINQLTLDLKTMGITIEITSENSKKYIVFEYDRDAYKRNAGRKRKGIPQKSFINKMDQSQLDEWLLNTPIESIEEELGIARSTAFRRRAEARERTSYAVISLEKTNID